MKQKYWDIIGFITLFCVYFGIAEYLIELFLTTIGLGI